MIKRIALFVASLSLLAGIFTPAIASASVFDNSKEAVCSGVSFEESASCESVTAGKKDPNAVVRTALQIFAAIVGVIAVFVIIIGAVKFITAGGDSSKVSQAKDTIMYAAIGLAIAALAQAIVQFVIKKVG